MRVVDPNSWVTVRQLIDDAAWLGGHLPGDLDAVIGVARSGLMPAQQIAGTRHLPLFACRISWSHAEEAVVDVGNGWRLCDYQLRPLRKVLLIDDTAWYGRSMDWATTVVRRWLPGAEIVRAAVYATSHSQAFLDAWACTYDGLHYLEWNLFNSGHAETLATDFDGILCPDFTAEEDDDGPRYLEAMRGRPALQTPRRAVLPAIITSRLEKYRSETMQWLADYGIRYRQLLMGPWRTRAERERADVAGWKARQFLSTGLKMFVESDPAQAVAIHRRTGKSVLCPALGKLLEGD
jgi:orotate phosphoribosyltransferase